MTGLAFQCGACGAAYANMGDFWTHLADAHPRRPVALPPPPCVECGGTGRSCEPGYGAYFRSKQGRCARCFVAYKPRRARRTA